MSPTSNCQVGYTSLEQLKQSVNEYKEEIAKRLAKNYPSNEITTEISMNKGNAFSKFDKVPLNSISSIKSSGELSSRIRTVFNGIKDAKEHIKKVSEVIKDADNKLDDAKMRFICGSEINPAKRIELQKYALRLGFRNVEIFSEIYNVPTANIARAKNLLAKN